MPTSTSAQLTDLLACQRAAHLHHTPDYAQRMDDLSRLRAVLKCSLNDIAKAVSADFGRRSWHESMISDGMNVLNEIDYIRAHLRQWMKPQRKSVDTLFWPARAEIRFQPVGVVGVISPWNYPVNLALKPLASALAAGNHVMLKPSEHTPRIAELLKKILGEIFPQERVATVLGGPEVATAFASLPFDHLFFTGSTEIGKKVMAAAAANLTPVTLELGGKSPAIIAPDYPLTTATERICAGKFLNAGQTCIAPDYVLLPKATLESFVDCFKSYISQHYPDVLNTPDFASIAIDRQYERLQSLLDDAKNKGAVIISMGDANKETRILPPTLVLHAHDDMRIMQEEIFGPVLPVHTYTELKEAIDYINARPRPLALYHFDHDRKQIDYVLEATIAGGVTINDTLLHIAQKSLPFGGIGPSGMGHYHGHAGFLCFSKQKPVFYQGRFSIMSLLRPPYRTLADRIVKFLIR